MRRISLVGCRRLQDLFKASLYMFWWNQSIMAETIHTNDNAIYLWMNWDYTWQKIDKSRVKTFCSRARNASLCCFVKLLCLIWFDSERMVSHTACIKNLFLNFLTLIFKHTGVINILLKSIHYTLMNTDKTASSIKPNWFR